MPNKPYAIEWLAFSKKNLDTARLLFDAEHYEDIIGIELQQALEKMLKAVFAWENQKISRTHKLLELISRIESIGFSAKERYYLEVATDYYRTERYPNPNYELPSREEIQEVLLFSENLFKRICALLQIEESEIMV